MLCGCFPVKGTGQFRYIDEPTVEAMYYRYWLRNCFPQLEQCRTVLGGSLYPHSNKGVAKEPSQFPDFHSIKNKIFRFLYQLVSHVLLSFQ